MAEELRFYGWQRSSVYDLATGAREDGRLQAGLPLALRDRDNATDRAERSAPFLIVGPRDVLGLQPGAITGMMPPPDSSNAETTTCVYVEFQAVDLPWRYTPERAVGLGLRPWIVLIVGTTDEIQLGARNTITFSAAVANAHSLNESARWAHVQDTTPTIEDGRRAIARLLSPRPLAPDAEHIAAVVPAFDANGAPAWRDGASPTLPCYHSWSFRTGEAGDFRTLASRLKPGAASPALGRAPLSYRRVDPPATLSVRGALAPSGGTDAPLDQPVEDDVAQLLAPLQDPRGRPIVTLPIYGAAWVADPATTDWGAAVNGDPRHRGAAGLGVWTGIELQEQIMDAAAQQVGALDIAAQQIRQLTLGLNLSRSLWERRLPEDPAQRLLLYGPALRRLVTPNGPVLDQIAGAPRPLPRLLFSSAARRVLRSGPARTALAQPNAIAPAALLGMANRCPPLPERVVDGLPHADVVAEQLGRDTLDNLILIRLRQGRLEPGPLLQRFLEIAEDPRWEDLLSGLVDRVRQSAAAGRLLYFQLVEVLIAVEVGDREEVQRLVEGFDFQAEPDEQSLLELGDTMPAEPPRRRCRPVDLSGLEPVLTRSIDPTVDEPLVQRRVLDGITGLDDQPLAPTEVCVGIDLPVWTFLRDRAPDWLLPGVNDLEEDAAVALESNPTFVDAFLLGLNTQVLSELRWRNVPVATGCTPMRMFWGQVDVATNSRKPDIRGVETWPAASELGDPDHQPPPPVGTDLVLVLRSDLFRRFPKTLIYAAPAPIVNGQPDWNADPPFGGDRLLPTFQGSIGEDITFFRFDVDPQTARGWWIVLEEPPPGYGFRNDVPVGAEVQNGADFADVTFNDPVRVLLRGDRLVPGG
jgi:hypothetical protein